MGKAKRRGKTGYVKFTRKPTARPQARAAVSKKAEPAARRVAIVVRANNEDAFVLSFDRKALASVFGSTEKKKRTGTGAGAAEFAEGIRVALQMAAPALTGGMNMPSPPPMPVDIGEVAHAENIARAHENLRRIQFKHCPHCGQDLKPS